jgi:cytochrome c biogenesis protein CcmG, thiol:disulfide interchange protein DsbE
MDHADEVPAGPPEATGSTTEPDAAPEPGSLGPHPERHPDDLPPTDLGRPRVPSGVLWALALAVVVLTIASFVAFSAESEPTPADDVARLTDPNAPIPLEQLGGVDVVGQQASATPYTTFDGGTTSLAEHSGRPMVVNFWADWCTPCLTEMPAFEQVHQAAGDQVAFVGLAVSSGEAKARELAAETKVTYDLGFDPSGQIIRASGGAVLPTTVFVDADGTIVETHALVLDEAELRNKIEAHFGIDVPPPS